ncbi:MAG: EMC3/TMCO1 family protein [Candidatus Hadarchaeaceae archaeon]
MRRLLVCPLIVVFLLASFAMTAGAEEAEDEHGTYKVLLQTVDSSIISLRQGGSASGSLSQARTLYNSLVGPYENDNFGGSPKLIEIDNRITQAFNSLQQSATEENIRVLRSDISLMASELGIGLSSIYEYALFIVLGIGIFVSLLITLITRRVVNWERMRQIKAEVTTFQKELREAQRKRDMKSVHKLQQDQKRIMSLQGVMMKENFKPTLFYIVPYFIFWFILSGIYAGWVVAWLPFRLDLPFFGTWVSCGFLSWYLLTYFGFSQMWRKLLIRD